MEFIATLFFLAVPIALITAIILGVKRRKRPALIALGISLVSLVLMVVIMPDTVRLSLEKDSVETNELGVAVIEGSTNGQAELLIDGKPVPNDQGSFNHTVTLTDETPQKVIVTTQYKKEKLSKTVTVKASTAFAKHLADEEKRLAQVAKEKERTEKIALETKQTETALVLAEKDPTQANYDAASTLVKGMTANNQDFSDRLDKVKQTIQLAAEKTEKTAKAETALATAEEQPTKPHFEAAKVAIAAIPGGSESLTTRLETVNTTILAAEQEASRQREVAAQAAAEVPQLPETGGDQVATTQTVLVTRTGEKYHARKCGNGTYTEATMDQALARGLTPCSKCF